MSANNISMEDYKFIELCLAVERDKLDAVLQFILDEGMENKLVSYLDAWVEKDNEKIDYESVSDIVDRIQSF